MKQQFRKLGDVLAEEQAHLPKCEQGIDYATYYQSGWDGNVSYRAFICPACKQQRRIVLRDNQATLGRGGFICGAVLKEEKKMSEDKQAVEEHVIEGSVEVEAPTPEVVEEVIAMDDKQITENIISVLDDLKKQMCQLIEEPGTYGTLRGKLHTVPPDVYCQVLLESKISSYFENYSRWDEENRARAESNIVVSLIVKRILTHNKRVADYNKQVAETAKKMEDIKTVMARVTVATTPDGVTTEWKEVPNEKREDFVKEVLKNAQVRWEKDGDFIAATTMTPEKKSKPRTKKHNHSVKLKQGKDGSFRGRTT